MSIVLPLCPICHKMYSSEVLPYIIQPCCHGCCFSCLEEYMENHDGKTCPTCRGEICDISPNYDLREICNGLSIPKWSEKLARLIPTGIVVDFESIEDVSELIYLRLSDADSFLVKKCITRYLTQHPFEFVLKWVLALNFENETEYISFAAKQHENYLFLDSHSASWILSLV